MRSLAILFGASIVGVSFAAGCSGAADSGLYTGDGSQGSQTSSGTSGSSGGSSGGTSTSGGASSSGASGTGSSSGEQRDGGSSGGRDADKEASTPPFGCGTGPTGAPLTCTGGALCCAEQTYIFPTTVQTDYACVANAGQCQFDGGAAAVILCHNENECGGHFCCGDFNGTGYLSVGCALTCDPSDSGARDKVRFCDPSKSSADCPSGQTCGQSTVLPGFYRCG